MIKNPAFLEISEKESIMREELQNATDTSTVAYEKKLLLWGDIYQNIQTLFLDCVLESKALDLKIPVFIYFDKNKKQHAKATIDKEIGINAASDKNKDLIYIKSNMAHEITHVISKQKSKTDWWRNEKLLDRTDKKHQSQLSREDQQKFPYYYQSPEEARANLQGLIQKHNNILNIEFVENYSKLHNQSVRKSVHDVIEYCINDIVLKHRQYLPNYTHKDYFGKEYLLFLKKGLYDYIFNQKGTKPIIIMPEPVKKIISDAYKIFEKERYSIGELEAYRNLLSALESEKNKINPETKRSNAIYLQEYVDYVERKINKLAYVRNVSFNLKKYGEKQKLLISLPDYVYDLLSDISNSGGRALVVGGAVRDAILGKSPKDIDFEVYGLNYDELNQILSKYGKADLVGQSFGVIKFVGKDGMDFDFSLPRLDSKAGVGHKDFNVEVRSDLTPEEAAARRDFTINAISYDPITHEIVDPYNGRQDLTNKILRHTSDAFAEDPLRVLRGMQFASRFGFDIAPETAELAQSIREEFQHLPKERIYEEFKKLVTKGIEPGKALDFLYTTGWSANFPEIHDLKDTPQDSEWHPEGWSIRIMPPDSFTTGVAIAKPINLLSRELLLNSTTDPTSDESRDITANTQFSIKPRTVFTNLLSTKSAGVSDFMFSPLVFSPTFVTPSKSFVRGMRTAAQQADKIIGVMFQIPISSVLRIMSSSIDNNQIFQGIIKSVAIYVMNMFASFQDSSQMKLHDVSMQEHTPRSSSRNRNFSISPTVIDPKFSVIDNNVVFYFYLRGVGDVDTHNNGIVDNHIYFLVELGDVAIHTAHVMNEAARIADRENLSPEQREVLIYAALAHDFAKPETTAVTNKKGKDRITSHGHEEKGGPKTRAFLESIGAPKKVIDQVVPLVEYHLAHIHHSNTSKQDSFVKNLAEKIYPSNLKMLSYLIEADHSGRPPLEKKLPDEAKTMIEKANELGVFEDKAQDLLQGRDIMVYTKKGGPIIGQILKEHRKMILDHDPRMKNRETALEWLQNRMQREVAFINGYDVVENTNLKGRDIKDMLDEAWKAQLNGEFNDKAEALQWMKKNLTKFNTI